MKTYDLSPKTIHELVSIVEQPEDYVDLFVKQAKQELKERNHPQKELVSMAENVYRTRCKDLFAGGLFQYENYELPKSFILPEKQTRKLFQAELKAFIRKRRLMNDGLDSYGTSGV